MATITSESPDGKRRIVIDSLSGTVCFIGCHIPSEQEWFSLHPRIQAEFTCLFGDILAVYTLPDTRDGKVFLEPRHLNRI